MKIALDYDGTYTADPALWDGFIARAKARGHSVWIVTCRRDTEENREEVKVPGCFVIFTGLAPKDWYCREPADSEITSLVDVIAEECSGLEAIGPLVIQ